MKTRTYLKLCLASLLLLISISCNEDGEVMDCASDDIAYVDEVDAPKSGKVNETIAISVSFSMKNTCGSFNRFNEISTEEGLIIEVFADYFGCSCGQALKQDIQNYEFTPAAPGRLELNFRSGPVELISVTIEVNE